VVAISSGVIFLIGGNDDLDQSSSSTVEAYDPATNTWHASP
jgi:hypothetical protein